MISGSRLSPAFRGALSALRPITTTATTPCALTSTLTSTATPRIPIPIPTPIQRIPRSPFLLFLQQTRPLTQEVRTAIDRAVGSAPVVLFMKGTPETPQCGFSRTLIQILGLQGVDPAKFTAFNVLEDDELRGGIKEYSDWPTIPQLYVGGEFVGGCDILMGMHRDGSLAKMLDEKGVLVGEQPTQPE